MNDMTLDQCIAELKRRHGVTDSLVLWLEAFLNKASDEADKLFQENCNLYDELEGLKQQNR